MKSLSFLIILCTLYFLSITIYRKRFVQFSVDQSASLKGILSILIILSHVNFHADLPIFQDITKWAGTKVALFFFISGFGLMASFRKKEAFYLKGFFKNRIWKIVLPLLLLSLIFLVIYYLDSGIWDQHVLMELVQFGKTPLPYSWFAYVIILFYVFFYFIFRFKLDQNKRLLILTFLAIMFSFLLYYLKFDRAWWVSNLAFPLGMIYQSHEKSIAKICRNKYGNVLVIPILGILTFLLAFTRIEFLYVFAYVFIVLMVIILLSYTGLPTGRVYNFLGKISYETYLIHGGVYYLLRGNHVYIQNNYVYLLTVIAVSLLLASLFHRFFKYCFSIRL